MVNRLRRSWHWRLAKPAKFAIGASDSRCCGCSGSRPRVLGLCAFVDDVADVQVERFCKPTSKIAEIASPTIKPLEKFGRVRISFSSVEDKAINAATPPWR